MTWVAVGFFGTVVVLLVALFYLLWREEAAAARRAKCRTHLEALLRGEQKER